MEETDLGADDSRVVRSIRDSEAPPKAIQVWLTAACAAVLGTIPVLLVVRKIASVAKDVAKAIVAAAAA